jgi:hypothetical protein
MRTVSPFDPEPVVHVEEGERPLLLKAALRLSGSGWAPADDCTWVESGIILHPSA